MTDPTEPPPRHEPEAATPTAGDRDALTRESEPYGYDLIKTDTGETLWEGSRDEEVTATAVTATTDPVPEDQLRRWSLLGIGGAVLLTLTIITAGTASHWFTEDFAKLLLQTVIPPLLSAFAVVVGYLFAERKRR